MKISLDKTLRETYKCPILDVEFVSLKNEQNSDKLAISSRLGMKNRKKYETSCIT